MSHPNARVLEKIYADFAAGHYEAAMESCAENMTFQIAGKSGLAGKYDRRTFVGSVIKKFVERSEGTHSVEVHDILASDRHGLVLTTESVVRDGKKAEYRTVHVWRIEGGKPVAWYLYPRDLYQFDALWG
jgi:ketosteroid isomerase-like protein